ncbi:LysR family transcriptional regulator [Beijerinckia indica]|nr:LysR family transcriptional regulator [Beijerinckia indica]
MGHDFLDMLVFVRIIEAGSLSGAARELDLSLAVVSRRLARLEERLGVRLINRTTRTLAPTEEGAAFHARCARILADLDEAEQEVTQGRDVATGLLRLTSPVAFGQRWLAPLLHDFQALHPRLQIYLDASDTVMNLVESGYDLAIRLGGLSDSSLIARQIAPDYRVICAAPSYLARRGRPHTIEDLAQHDCIIHGRPPMDHWTFADGRTIKVRGTLASNHGALAQSWALQGAGLVLKSMWDVRDDVIAGRLEIVLPNFPLPMTPIHAVYPHSRYAAARVRLCVDYLIERLRREVDALQPDSADAYR